MMFPCFVCGTASTRPLLIRCGDESAIEWACEPCIDAVKTRGSVEAASGGVLDTSAIEAV